MTATDLDEVVDAPPPAARLAEWSVIGAALCSPNAYTEVVETGLTARDFYSPGCENAWAAVVALSERGEPHDPLTVREEMLRQGTFRSINLTDLADAYGAARPELAATHARLVMDKAARRRALAAATRIAQLARTEQMDLAEMAAQAQDAVDGIAVHTDDSTWSYLDDVLDLVYAAAEEAAVSGRPGGIAWGYGDVDDQMAPMVPGEFAVVSAYSGGGKSVVAGRMALHAAVHQGKRVLLHAMEMTRLEVGQRWVAAEAHVELERVISGKLSPADHDRIDRANARMVGSPLVIDEVETITLAGLRASVRKHQPEFVVVDQIPTMTPSDTRLTREQQVSGLAYGLKRLAKAEGVPVLACCQLNTNSQKRTDKTPTMHDLRESQAIVQAANTLVILSDPMEVDKDSGRAGEVDWIIRKQRQGPKDVVVPLARLFHYSKLGDLAS